MAGSLKTPILAFFYMPFHQHSLFSRANLGTMKYLLVGPYLSVRAIASFTHSIGEKLDSNRSNILKVLPGGMLYLQYFQG